MHTHRTSGFSMVELLTTLVVLAVLLGLVVARYNEVQNDATIVAGEQSAKNLTSAYNNWEAAGGVAGDQVATSDILRILKEDSTVAISRSNRARSIADGGNSSAVRASIPDEIALPSPDEPPLEEVQADGYKLKFDNEKKEFVSTPTLGFGGGSTGSSSTGGSTTGGNTTPPPSGGGSTSGGDTTGTNNEQPPPDDGDTDGDNTGVDTTPIVILPTITYSPNGGYAEIIYNGTAFVDIDNSYPPNIQVQSYLTLKDPNTNGTVSFWNTAQGVVRTWDYDTRTYTFTNEFARQTWRLSDSNTGPRWDYQVENLTTGMTIESILLRASGWMISGSLDSAVFEGNRQMNGAAGVQISRISNDKNSAFLINRIPTTASRIEWFPVAGDGPPGYWWPQLGWDSTKADTPTPDSRDVAIQPGQSRSLSFEIRLSPVSAKSTDIAADIYSTYRQLNPMRLVWPDRRPLAAFWTFSGSVPRFRPPMNTPEEIAAYQAVHLATADEHVAILLAANSQGIIFWDLEGKHQYENNYAYAGDPRLIPTLNPAFDAIADQFFKKFTDAGLRVGMTIRNSSLTQDNNGNWIQPFPQDETAEYIAKINYAKNRWGVTLFYIDVADLQDHRALERVYDAIPGILLIPETQPGTGARYNSFSAPYVWANGFSPAMTPLAIRNVYPNAFSVVWYGDSDQDARKDEIIAAARRGDIIMSHTFSQQKIQDMLDAAGVDLIVP